MRALITNRSIYARSLNLLAKKSFGKGLEEAEIPQPVISSNEVLVRVHATALNPIDAKFVDFIAPPGRIAGCDFAGVVSEVGQHALDIWKIGDRVAGFVQGGIDEGRGAFAEYVKIEGDLLWRIPEGMSDEEASTFGIPAATAMQALYLHLDVPWPKAERALKDGSTPGTILIYAGSSAVGLFAIQLAKKAGYTVVTTASPHSFDLVTSYGADRVFDYHTPTAIQEITKDFPDITRALDCFSEGDSTEFCARVIAGNGGKVVTLLDTKINVPGVEAKMIMSFQLLGRAFAWIPPIGPNYPISPKDRQALVQFYADLFGFAGEIKAPPIISIEGKFRGIVEGLEKLRLKKVSGAKLVVRLT